MIFKPTNIVPDSLTFPANENIEISWKNNGDMMVAYEVVVTNISLNTVEYSSGKTDSFVAKHTIPSGSLINGREYKYTVKVYNSAGASVTSDSVVLRCSARPVVTVASDGYIRNQIATVYAEYSHTESLPIKAYKFVLYDEFENVLEQTDYIYNELLTHTFNYKLEDDKKYFIECVAVSQKDVLGTSGLIEVIADYIPPTVHFKLTTETFPDKPYVRLIWNTIRILGKSEGEISFADGKVNTINGKVYFDEGFNVEKNFTLKLWVDISSVTDKKIIAQLSSYNARIEISIYDGKIHAFKHTGGFVFHVASEITGDNGTEYFICLQQIDREIELTCEVV